MAYEAMPLPMVGQAMSLHSPNDVATGVGCVMTETSALESQVHTLWPRMNSAQAKLDELKSLKEKGLVQKNLVNSHAPGWYALPRAVEYLLGLLLLLLFAASSGQIFSAVWVSDGTSPCTPLVNGGGPPPTPLRLLCSPLLVRSCAMV